jgi:hypothetical protein
VAALFEVVVLRCDYCREEFELGQGRTIAQAALKGWTAGTFSDGIAVPEGESLSIPVSPEVFANDIGALIACPKPDCQKALQTPIGEEGEVLE